MDESPRLAVLGMNRKPPRKATKQMHLKVGTLAQSSNLTLAECVGCLCLGV